MRKIFGLFLCTLVLFGIVGCSNEETTPPAPTKVLSLDKTTAEVTQGGIVEVTLTTENLEGELTVTPSDATKAVYTNDKNVYTITTVDNGNYSLTFAQDGLTAKIDVKIYETSDIKVALASTKIEIGEVMPLAYTAADSMDDLELNIDDKAIATFKEVGNNIIEITGVAAGSTTLTLTQGTVDVEILITVEEVKTTYTICDGNGVAIPNGEGIESFYEALNTLLTYPDLGGGFHIVKDDIAWDPEQPKAHIAYTYSTGGTFDYFDQEGLSHTYLDSIKDDGGKYVNPGQHVWWGSYATDLGLYGQDDVTVFLKEDPNFRILDRPTSFNFKFDDGYAGLNGKAEDTWGGWQHYKSGLSTVQYVGWANRGDDTTADGSKKFDELNFEYNLQNSIMKPSENSQSTHADIYFGNNNLDVVANNIMGITFDAGNQVANQNLADGATREWRLFVENFNSHLTTRAQRTYSDETIGTATWNKELGVWEFDYSITLNQELNFDETTKKLTYVLTASVGDKKVSMTEVKDVAAANIDAYRLIYGVNYTPVLNEGDKIQDLQNGGYWIGVVQDDVKGLREGNEIINFDFLAGRTVNQGRFTGVYGCDVANVEKVNGKTTFSFKY